MTAQILRKIFVTVSIALGIVITAVGSTPAQYVSYTDISPEGARFASAGGINARGDIVGTFVDQDFRVHGFLYRKGLVSVIDFPGADATEVRGIGPNGEIVGDYWFDTDPLEGYRGFKWTREGGFENVHYPGHSWEILQRILPDGTILGCRHDNDTSSTMRGIYIAKDEFGETEAYASMHNGATPNGQTIVGMWFNATNNRQEAYILEKGIFTSFIVPGSNLTSAWDINAGGSIAGIFRVGSTVRGYVRTGEEYSTIHFPGSAITRAFGINSRGDVVGNYVIGGVTKAFLAETADETTVLAGTERTVIMPEQ